MHRCERREVEGAGTGVHARRALPPEHPLLALHRTAGNAAVGRLIAEMGQRAQPAAQPQVQRQAATTRGGRGSVAAERERRNAEMATVVAESLVGASEDAARRQAKRREKAGNLDFEIEMSDGLTKAQADEARLLMGYPSAAAAAVQAADFDLAQEHNFGFLRGTASFLRTRDLTRAASATLDEALESAHLAGSMLSAFTSRRETTVSRIQQRIQSAAGHVRWVAQNLNEDTYATAARTFEQTNPSATADEKAKHRREQGIVSREQEAVLRDWYGPELAAADRSIDVSYATPDLTDIHRICTDQAGSLARFAEGLPPKAAGMIRTAVGELRQAGGMLAVLINPRRAAQALRGILIECRGSVDRMIALPRRHDPTMPPGPENPPPHRFRPRGLEAEPSPAPIEISPL